MSDERPPNECAVCGAPIEQESIDVGSGGMIRYVPGRYWCSENPGHDPRVKTDGA